MLVKCWSSAGQVLVMCWSTAGHIGNVDKIDDIDNFKSIDKIENIDKIDSIDNIESIDKIENIVEIDSMDQTPSRNGQVLVKCWSIAGHVLGNGWSYRQCG